jgi:hypothetical protein
MQKIAKRLSIAFYLSMFLSLCLVLVRIVFLVRYIEPETGLYYYGTNADIYFNIILVAVLLIIFAVCLPLVKLEEPKESPSETSFTIFASSFCGFMCISAFITELISVVVNNTTQSQALTSSSVSSIFGQNFNALSILQILFSIPSAIYFLMICLKKANIRSGKTAILSMAPIVFIGIRLISLFLDTHSAINSSERALSILTFCSMMLFFLCEVRFYLPELPDKKEKKQENLFQYYLFGLLTVALTTATVIPTMIFSAFWILEPKISYSFSVLDLSLALYAIARLVSKMQTSKQATK